MKIVVLIIVALVSSVFVIQRLIGNKSEKNELNKILHSIKTDKSIIPFIVKDLFKKYKEIPVLESFNLEKFIKNAFMGKEFGNTKINHIEKLHDTKYLIITTCFDEDYDVNFLGKMGKANRIYNINYLLEYDSGVLNVFSDFTSDSELKALRSSFARKIASRIVNI